MEFCLFVFASDQMHRRVSVHGGHGIVQETVHSIRKFDETVDAHWSGGKYNQSSAPRARKCYRTEGIDVCQQRDKVISHRIDSPAFFVVLISSAFRLFPTNCGRLLSDFLDSGVESEM